MLAMSIENILYIVKGIGLCLQYTVLAIILGSIIGLILAIMQMSPKKYCNLPAKFYISVFRGTPLLVQLSLMYYAIPVLIDYQISAFSAGVIAFAFNSAAYVGEIFRAGIQSVSKGQIDACKALRIPYYLQMRDIVLPQAVKTIYPALTNEIISLLKETALISVIGEADVMRRAQLVAAETYSYFGPLLIAACCYYIMVSLINKLSQKIEKWMFYA